MIQHLKQNSTKDFNIPEIDDYLTNNDGFKVLSSSFRNCMMHYDLIDKKRFSCNFAEILQSFFTNVWTYRKLL